MDPKRRNTKQKKKKEGDNSAFGIRNLQIEKQEPSGEWKALNTAQKNRQMFKSVFSKHKIIKGETRRTTSSNIGC